MRTLPSRKRPWKTKAAKQAARDRLMIPANKLSHEQWLAHVKNSRMAYPHRPNARFWYWIDAAGDYDCFVKITLRPDQELSYSRDGLCDEGWSRHYITFQYDANARMVYVHECTESQDCDGRHSHNWSGECPLESLQAVPADFGDEDPTVDHSIRKPVWERIGQSQRDHFAEAAGY